METGIVTDQQYIGVAHSEAAQAVQEPLAAGEVELVLDQALRPGRELSEHQIESFLRSPRARAKDEIESAGRCREVLANMARCITAAPAQYPLTILDILLGARLRMAKQVQHIHFPVPSPGRARSARETQSVLDEVPALGVGARRAVFGRGAPEP
jgi:hypothetical protein